MIAMVCGCAGFPAGWDIFMTAKTDPPETAKKPDRTARLAEELRLNLQRRKAQARSRRTGGADERPEGLGATRQDAAKPDG